MEFGTPGTADFFEIKKYVGSLAIIAVNEYITNFVTAQGVGNVIKAEVVIIDGPGAGDRYPDAMFFGKKIVPQMSSKVGSVMLAWITQGQAKAGQSAPYELKAGSTEDAAKANAWVTANGTVECRTNPDPRSATGNAYAPDQENWKVQGAQLQQQGYPKPPPMPNVYAGPNEQPPF